MHRSKQIADVDGFDEFWAQYPKKKAKKEAQKAWQQVRPTAEVRCQIQAALFWQSRQPEWLKDGGQFIPNAASWLRGERWEDERPMLPQLSERTAQSLKAIYGQ